MQYSGYLSAKALKSLAEAFLAGIEKGLKAAGLNYAGARYYAAPRRLAVLVEALAVQPGWYRDMYRYQQLEAALDEVPQEQEEALDA